MALIEIDDRDVYNFITPGHITQGDVLKQWLMELKANNPTAKVITLGEGRYQLDLDTIICTGAPVNTRFNIPHMHELIRVGIKHIDNSNADSVDALAYSISKKHYPNLYMLLLKIDKTIASDILDEYINYYMDSGEYLITSNTTNTDLIHLNVIVKITGA